VAILPPVFGKPSSVNEIGVSHLAVDRRMDYRKKRRDGRLLGIARAILVGPAHARAILLAELHQALNVAGGVPIHACDIVMIMGVEVSRGYIPFVPKMACDLIARMCRLALAPDLGALALRSHRALSDRRFACRTSR
jgi:hypothetical protein